jgi:hypothetical protein
MNSVCFHFMWQLHIAKPWQIWWCDEDFFKISKLLLQNQFNLLYEWFSENNVQELREGTEMWLIEI